MREQAEATSSLIRGDPTAAAEGASSAERYRKLPGLNLIWYSGAVCARNAARGERIRRLLASSQKRSRQPLQTRPNTTTSAAESASASATRGSGRARKRPEAEQDEELGSVAARLVLRPPPLVVLLLLPPLVVPEPRSPAFPLSRAVPLALPLAFPEADAVVKLVLAEVEVEVVAGEVVVVVGVVVEATAAFVYVDGL
mmetsp:Transcript_76841/g.237323  ORF Transcript_76841/g.237323 Transcript_76841/m.237323 type:complete len:198 (-) Transcript_76841:236-829(-)